MRPPPPCRTAMQSRAAACAALAASLGTAPAVTRAQSATAAPRAAALAPVERAVVRAVDARAAASLALLRQIVDVNSGTLNPAGVRRVGDVLRAQLDSLGFATRWVDGAPFGRAGHLVAERRGTGPKLLLIGHLDTVFEPSSPFQRFEQLNDSTARGPGIIDMKGGDVIIVAALRALADARALDGMHVVVVFDGDEEDPGAPLAEARRALTDAARGAAAALGFEDGAADPRTAVIARRGASGWTLTSTGTPAHSSQIFRPTVGAGAVFESARVLGGVYQQLAREPYLTFNPGIALGGTAVAFDTSGTRGTAAGKDNVVAERMTVRGDLRALSPVQLEHARGVMRAVAAAPLPGTRSTIAFDDGYPPMAPTDGNRRLLAAYDQASRDLGFGPVTAVDPSRAGAADVSFTAALVPMAIDGLGLSGHDDHTAGETADLRMLAPLTKRAAVLLYRLHRGAAGR